MYTYTLRKEAGIDTDVLAATWLCYVIT